MYQASKRKHMPDLCSTHSMAWRMRHLALKIVMNLDVLYPICLSCAAIDGRRIETS